MRMMSIEFQAAVSRQIGSVLCLLVVLAGCGSGTENAATEPVVASDPATATIPSDSAVDTSGVPSADTSANTSGPRDVSDWTFEQSAQASDLWLEVSIAPASGRTITRVEVIYDGKAGLPMILTSSGSYALDEPVLQGATWIYRAWDDQNGRHDSTPFNLSGAVAADQAFSAPDPRWTFILSPNNNPSWLDVQVAAEGSSISKVEAIVGHQKWMLLEPTAWNSYAFGHPFDASAPFFIRAWDAEGVSHDSTIFPPVADTRVIPAPATPGLVAPAPVAPDPAPPALSAQAIVEGFEAHPDGTIYDLEQQRKTWNAAWSNQMDQYARISSAQARFGKQSLQIEYPSSTQSSVGAKWLLPARGEYYLSYWLRFDHDFDFDGSRFSGGKLPGLGLGDLASGGKRPNGHNGFTSRYMWREKGKVVLYLYHMDQPGKYGVDFELRDPQGNQKSFVPGKWHKLTQRVKVNTGASSNGEIDVWMDDTPVLSLRELRMVSNNAKIDAIYFSTFHGGNTAEWWPERNVKAYFDEFIVSPSRSDVGL